MMSANAIAQNRFGLGARAGQAVAGDPRRWLLEQFARYPNLPPAWAAQPRTSALLDSFQAQQLTIRNAADDTQRAAARQQQQRAVRDVYLGAVDARFASALDTPAPFVERLVHFWSNHFALSVEKLPVRGLAGAYETDAIRPHVLGRFEDLLLAAVMHPAMLVYLDQNVSIGPDSPVAQRAAARQPQRPRGLNENLAREIMELHTLGARSGYTQADVTEFAKALTGLAPAPGVAGVDKGAANGEAESFVFRPALHQPGTRTVLGRSYAQQGEAQARAILHDLATAPDTARHVASKLARHFVADTPPPALVERLTQSYLRSGGDLPTLYRVLVESPEPWQAGAGKFKAPWDWAVSSLRGLGLRELPAGQGERLMAQLSQPVWLPQSPAGYDDVAASWAAPDALVRRVESAQRLAGRNAAALDARSLAPQLLPGGLSDATASAIARSESASVGLALLLVSPEFLRR